MAENRDSRGRLRTALVAGLSAVSLALLASAAPAQDGPLAGKDIRLIIPHTPGQGMDTYARMIAPYLVKHSGAAGITPENVTGSGGVRGNNELWQQEPDGTTIGFTTAASLMLADLSGSSGVQYKATEFTFLGRASTEPRLLLVGKQSDIKSAEDLKSLDRPFVYPSHGTDEDFYTFNIFADAIGMDLKIVSGYEGGAESSMSVFSGDTDGLILSSTGAAPGLEAGDWIPLMTFTTERTEQFPDLPTALEMIEGDDGPMRSIIAVLELSRAFTAPPGMSEELTSEWRRVVEAALKDPELLAQAEKANLPIVFLSGADQQAKVDEIAANTEKLVPLLKGALARLQ